MALCPEPVTWLFWNMNLLLQWNCLVNQLQVWYTARRACHHIGIKSSFTPLTCEIIVTHEIMVFSCVLNGFQIKLGSEVCKNARVTSHQRTSTHTHSIDRKGKMEKAGVHPCQTHYSALRICGWQNCQHNPIHVYALTGLWGLPFDHWSSRWSTGSKSANCQDLAGSQRMEWEASRPAGIAVDVIIDRW